MSCPVPLLASTIFISESLSQSMQVSAVNVSFTAETAREWRGDLHELVDCPREVLFKSPRGSSDVSPPESPS